MSGFRLSPSAAGQASGAALRIQRLLRAAALLSLVFLHVGSTSRASSIDDRLSALLDLSCLRRARVGIKVTRVRDGRVLFERGSDRSLQPASTLKLLTAAAALDALGSEFTFKTRFLSEAPIRDGVLEGDLIVQGGGAPDLTAERLWYAARALARLGLRRVRGDLVADESYFDSERRPAGWRAPGVRRAYNAPVGPLSFNFNVATLEVDPGAAPGERPQARLAPLGAGIELINAATTSSSRTHLWVEMRQRRGREQWILRGRIRRGSATVRLHRSVRDPARYTLGALRELLSREGVELSGGLKTGAAPAIGREIFVLESQPLSQVLFMMNKMSNNMMAEAILKTLGAESFGAPGTTASGLRVLRDFLERAGVRMEAVRLADGSGLSTRDTLPAAALVRLLEQMPKRFELWPEFLASLPIGGVDGTLSDRMVDLAQRHVRAKTGRVSGTVSLAGYAENQDGELLAFAVLVNQIRCHYPRVRDQIDRLALALAGSHSVDRPAADAIAAPGAAGP
ncbi:MAG: D-alanyl-D-alanine carboxypeptidase/D-alanyl-D-alanine-endopeptidase [Acidobacteriota bacterium]